MISQFQNVNRRRHSRSSTSERPVAATCISCTVRRRDSKHALAMNRAVAMKRMATNCWACRWKRGSRPGDWRPGWRNLYRSPIFQHAEQPAHNPDQRRSTLRATKIEFRTVRRFKANRHRCPETTVASLRCRKLQSGVILASAEVRSGTK